jgi:hypothetical protein
MSNRDVVIDFVKKLPEDASLHKFAREIELLAGIQTAREEAERGEGVPADKAFQLIDKLPKKNPNVMPRLADTHNR